MFRNQYRRLSPAISAALCAALVVLSPGLECYAAGGRAVSSRPANAGSALVRVVVTGGLSEVNQLGLSLTPLSLSGSIRPGQNILPVAAGDKAGPVRFVVSPQDGRSSVLPPLKASLNGAQADALSRIESALRTGREVPAALGVLAQGGNDLARAEESEQPLVLKKIFAENPVEGGVAEPPVERDDASLAGHESSLLQPAGLGESTGGSAQVPPPAPEKTRLSAVLAGFWRSLVADARDLFSGDPARVGPAWGNWTNHMAAISVFIFSIAPIPQMFLNFQNLLVGKPKMLENLPWTGYSSGTLANMILLGYFRSLKDMWPAIGQAISVLTNAVILYQIYAAGFMPLAGFAVVMPAIAVGLWINWLDHKGKPRLAETAVGPLLAKSAAWLAQGGRLARKAASILENVSRTNMAHRWGTVTSLLAVVIVPQVLWTTFAPYFATAAAAASLLPLVLVAPVALGVYWLNKRDRLPKLLKAVWDVIGAWSASIIFMYGPVAMHVYNFRNPSGLSGMSGIGLITFFLYLMANTLLLTRMMYTKNLIGTVGNLWLVFVGAIGSLIWMYAYGFFSGWLFWPLSVAVPAFLLFAYLMNRRYPPPAPGPAAS